MTSSLLDPTIIDAYLTAHVPEFDGLQEVRKFEGGQSNPTFLLTARSGRYVLRRQPAGELLKSAHAVDREFRVIKALQDSEVPVPRAIHLCEDRDVIGSLFFLMSFEDGRTFWNPAIPELDNQQRREVYAEMNRVLAALHDLDIEMAGLADYGKPGNYFDRQVQRWTRQYRASETQTIAAMDALIDWLPRYLPVDDLPPSLIHGDYRIDNLLFSRNSSQALALLDWELSTLGHPLADLAYQCMQWRLPHDAAIAGLGGIDREKLGIPAEQAYVDQYCGRRGLGGIDDWRFYLVFSFFRFAAILQGIQKRALEGNASSQRAFEYGVLAPLLAEMAMELINADQ